MCETTSDYSTYETKDGRSIRFSLTQTSQGAVSQRIAGEAEVTPQRRHRPLHRARYQAGDAAARHPAADAAHHPHPGRRPRRNQRLLVVPLFDGTSADGAQDTTSVLQAWQPPQPNARFPALASLGSARMRIAFFDRTPSSSAGGASSPDYEVGLRYYENGVADELKMEFGEFSVDGKMQELAVLPNPC